MPDKNPVKRLNDLMMLPTAVLMTASGFVAAVKNVGGYRTAFVILAVFGLVFFCWTLYRRIQKKKQREKSIRSQYLSTGFNETLSYTLNDANRFFGRKEDVQRLINQIDRDEYNLGVIYGESGVGKTSIIQAGLMPELDKRPIHCAYVSLNTLPKKIESVEILIDFINAYMCRQSGIMDFSGGFADVLSRMRNAEKNYSVLFLDQFEQVVDRISEDTRRQFSGYLEEATKNRVKAVISVRADYFAYVHDMFISLERNAMYFLKKFNKFQVREVVRRTEGVSENIEETQPNHPIILFEDAVIDDLKDSDGLIHPVELSLICSTMKRDRGRLDKIDYIEGGKKKGWLNKYLEDVLIFHDRKSSLQILNSMIKGDKSETLSVEDVSKRSGVSFPDTEKLLKHFEQCRIVVKEVEQNEC